MATTETVVNRVRRAVLTGDGVDGAIATEVRRENERSLRDSVAHEVSESEVSQRVLGFGPLQPFLDDPSIEEIWINEPGAIFVARSGRHERIATDLAADDVRTLVERMLRNSGRRIDISQPFVDASLPDGSRLHVVIPPITRQHWSINIRKFSRSARTLADLVTRGTLSLDARALIADAVRGGKTILVSGATQAGKTTMVCALLDELESTERIVTVEETFEIASTHGDVVGMQCRGASLDGVGEVTLRRLVKEALRMRPTRLVVGEVRGDEALDLLVALNSGIPGLCTIHANSAGDAVRKLVTLCQLAGGVSEAFVASTIVATIDLVVHCQMTADGSRRVIEIARPTNITPAADIEMESLWVLT
jgi:pilus assembly protein CpaF